MGLRGKTQSLFTIAAAIALVSASLFWSVVARPQGDAVAIPAPLSYAGNVGSGLQTAVIAGGCFWGMQGVFQHVKGVRRALAGYSGGDKSTANYHSVSTGATGHAESIEITFDPKEISFGEILQIYFSVAHDPTEIDRQGPDIGTEYRSVIFYADEAQQQTARLYIEQLNKAGVFHQVIATRIDPLKAFYPAEPHHQEFMLKHPAHPYIVQNDLPKIENLKKFFPARYSETPSPGTPPRSAS
jgi:peptide-methionine (S)-S-oxide reductase